MYKRTVEFIAKTNKWVDKEQKIDKTKVSGAISFIVGKKFVFGEPDPDTLHAIVDDGNGTEVGLFFPQTGECTIVFPVYENIRYGLRPFVPYGGKD